MYIKNCDPDNFANENTISCISSSLNELISELEQEGNIATQRFRDNSILLIQIQTITKFQTIIIDWKNQKIIFPKSLQ